MFFLTAILLWSSLHENYRALFWVTTDAVITKVEVKPTHRKSRYSSQKKTVLNLIYNADEKTYTGKLIIRSETSKYKSTKSLKILRNPSDPRQIDFQHKKEDLHGKFFAIILVFALCAYLLIKEHSSQKH